MRTVSRIAASATMLTVAALGLAAPVQANEPAMPEGPGSIPSTTVPAPDDGWELTQLAAGALGGIALAGAGIAAAAGLRRRHAHATHTA